MESGLSKYCEIHQGSSILEWCSLCEQALCLKCKEYHSQAQITKNHTTIPITNFLQLPRFVHSLKKHCDEHDEKLNYFCPAHEEICCFNCIQSTHKQCNGVAQLHKVAENVKVSTSMEDLERNIADIILCMDKILLDRSQNISNLDKQYSLSVTKIRNFKKEIIRYIDNLEKQAVTDLKEKITTEKLRIDKLRSKIMREKIEICRIAKELTAIKTHASDTDTFLALQILTKKIYDAELFFQSLESEDGFSTAEVSYQKSDCINSLTKLIQSLGIINLHVRQNKIKLRQFKKQAQLCETFNETAAIEVPNYTGNTDSSKSQLEMNFNFQASLQIPGEKLRITSCKILPDNQFLFLDHSNHCIILYGNSGKFIIITKLSSKPYDMAYLSEHEAAVTLSTENSVSLVDPLKATQRKNFKTAGQCYGIAFANSKLFICLPYQLAIQIVDPSKMTDEEHLVTTKQSAFTLTYISGKLVCSNMKTNTLFCISTSGENLWEYCHDTLIEPLGLTTDYVGDIYVACRLNNSVIIVSANGKKSQEFIREIPKLKTPRALDFCLTTGTLIVCDEHLGLAVVFKLLNKEIFL